MDEQKIIAEIEENLEALVPEAVHTTVKTVEVVKNNPILIGLAFVLGAGAGAFVTYRATKKHLEEVYQQIAEDEIREAREIYAQRYKADDFETPEGAVRRLIPEEEREALEAMDRYQGRRIDSVEIEENAQGLKVRASIEQPEKPIQQRNIFVNGKPLDEDEWDADAEEANRDESKPYVISEDEFNENEPDFDDEALTYYEGDDVLVDSYANEPVHNVEKVVGEENLKRFGHGTKDKNLVHIRNHELGLNIEVTRNRGKYTNAVLDIEDEPPVRSRRSRGGEE